MSLTSEKFNNWKPLAPRLMGALLAQACFMSMAAGETTTQNSLDDPRIAHGWHVVRMVDCARCHGRSYEGLAAPSIIDYVATQNREAFVRTVLDGDMSRGMPGYRSNSQVVESIDDIYRYFVARAKGEIGSDYRAPVPAERQ